MTEQPVPSTPPPTSVPPVPDRKHHGWIGGVAATVSDRTGVPAGVVRAGWVLAVLFLSQTGSSVLTYVPIICYGACWFTLSKQRAERSTLTQVASTPQPTTPTRSTVPSPGTTADPGSQDDRPHLKDLVTYLWGNDPTPQPVYSADLTGVSLTGLQLPGTSDPGYYAPRMPFGKVYVYADYLVFLTESHNKPGEVPPLGRSLSVLLDAWRAIGFWRPIPLARAVYQRITIEELDRLRKPLGNPNSLVVPLSQVRGVSTRSYVMTRYVVIHTDERDVMIAPNSYLAMLGGLCLVGLLLRSIRLNVQGIFGLPWERDLVAALQRGGACIDRPARSTT